MADTSIEWTDRVWNPVRGCALVSEGCRRCYAMRQAHRFSGPSGRYEALTKLTKQGPRWTGEARIVPTMLPEPLGWTKASMVFVNSMSDLFHPDVPREYIAAVFGVMALGCHHTYQVLTKRPERMAEVLSTLTLDEALDATLREPWGRLISMPRARSEAISREMRRIGRDPRTYEAWPLEHVWLGVSVENQDAADERIPHLLATPAAVRFLSCEPLLGPLDLRPHGLTPDHHHRDALTRRNGVWGTCSGCPRDGSGMPYPERCQFWERYDHRIAPIGIHWVIVGGESGHGARPCDVAWVRSVLEQGKQAGVPVFVKQLGATPVGVDELRHPKGGDPAEWPRSLRVQEWPR
jgi:protein gp37